MLQLWTKKLVHFFRTNFVRTNFESLYFPPPCITKQYVEDVMESPWFLWNTITVTGGMGKIYFARGESITQSYLQASS